MKTLILTLALTVAITPTVHGKTQGSETVRPVSQEQELKALDLSRHQAVADRDVDILGRLLADDYQLNVDAARMLTKAQEIEAVKASDPLFDFVSFKLKDVTARFEVGRATVSGILIVKPRSGNKDSRRRYFYTRTFIRRYGRWQAIMSRLVTLSTDVR